MTTESVTIESAGAVLEGMLQAAGEQAAGEQPAGILVVCHPHPLYGGSMDNNVVDALCDAALQEGFSALRFNFRGVGRSTGEHAGGEAEQQDVLAAIELARARLPDAAIGLAGYSFGAATAAKALALAGALPRAMVLVSPPVASLATQLTLENPPPRLYITGTMDHVSPADELQQLAERGVPPAQCVIIEDADHSWWGHEAQLRDVVGSFLRWHLSRT
jgi:uncharacterized protein